MSCFVYHVSVPVKTPKYMLPVTEMMKEHDGALFVSKKDLEEFVKQLQVRVKEANSKSPGSYRPLEIRHHEYDSGGSINLSRDKLSGSHSIMFYRKVERVLRYDETLYGFVNADDALL